MVVVVCSARKRCFYSVIYYQQQRKSLKRSNFTTYIAFALSTFIGTTWIQQLPYTRAYMTSKMSSTFMTVRDNGTITISPKNDADQSALIIISHGLGDSAEGFVDVAEVIWFPFP
jgi:hypothetical protein